MGEDRPLAGGPVIRVQGEWKTSAAEPTPSEHHRLWRTISSRFPGVLLIQGPVSEPSIPCQWKYDHLLAPAAASKTKAPRMVSASPAKSKHHKQSTSALAPMTSVRASSPTSAPVVSADDRASWRHAGGGGAARRGAQQPSQAQHGCFRGWQGPGGCSPASVKCQGTA